MHSLRINKVKDCRELPWHALGQSLLPNRDLISLFHPEAINTIQCSIRHPFTYISVFL